MAKILFVQHYNDCELIGITSIASYIKPKHQAAVVFGSYKNIIKKYNSFKPNVVGISVLTKDHNWVLNLAAQIKSIDKNSIILLGGPHPTFYPDIIKNRYIDAVCIGEGEKPVLNLLNSIDDNEDYTNIPSIWVKKNHKLYKNEIGSFLKPEEIPIPDRMIYNEFPKISKSQIVCVMCSRGCPFNCYFCYNYGFKKMYGGAYLGIRKTEDIIKEITIAKENRDIKIVRFQDDIFGMNKKWLQEFLKQYKEKIKLPFYCLLRCEYITESVIDQLKEAGCFRVGIGIESGNEYIRNKVLNKNLLDAAIEKAVKILKDKNLKFHAHSMFGLPQEDFKSALETLELNIKLKADYVRSFIFQPYPGTKFFSEEVKESILASTFNMFKINYSYSKDSIKIQRLQKLFMITAKFPIIRYFLPILIKLPIDKIYDRVSQLSWFFPLSRFSWIFSHSRKIKKHVDFP